MLNKKKAKDQMNNHNQNELPQASSLLSPLKKPYGPYPKTINPEILQGM